MIEEKTGYCSLCKSHCGATYTIEDGRLISAGPAPAHPTGKSLCVKGKAAPEIIYNKERVLYPLKRTNPKTAKDPGWRRISWQDALDEVIKQLTATKERHGAEAVAFATATPSGTALSDAVDWVERLVRLFDTPNWITSTEVCNWHKDFAHAFTFGTGIAYPDYANAETIVLWGFNPSSVWLDQATQIAEARARGAKIVAIDPRQAGFAIGAKHWLRVRPGSDGVLALGLIRLLIESGGYDDAFVRRWSNAAFLVRGDDGRFLRRGDISGNPDERDFAVVDAQGSLTFVERNSATALSVLDDAQLRGTFNVTTATGVVSCRPAFDLLVEAVAPYDAKNVAELTWIPEADIRAAAEALSSSKRVAYYAWTGLGQHAEATQIDRALSILMSLKGCFDAPGGNLVLASQPRNAVAGPGMLSAKQAAKALGLDTKPIGPPIQGRITVRDFYSSAVDGKPYRVRALVAFGSNLTLAHANPSRGRDALQALDFYVHCDTFENPSARFADILLPVNTPWEREALQVGFGSGQAAEEFVQLRQRMIAPLGESRSDADICFELATRLGFGDQFFGGDIDAGYDFILEPSGIALSDLRAHPEGIRKPLKISRRKYAAQKAGSIAGFATETGKVELYSELLHRHGQRAIPGFDLTAMPGSDAFPFVLTTSKMGYFCHSQHRQISSLRKREPYPSVELSPSAAEGQGVGPGDWVRIETAHGATQMKVKINKSLHDRVVRASYGWWQANSDLGLPDYDAFDASGANYNLMIGSDRLDPISGVPALRSGSCRIVPVSSMHNK